MNDSHDRGDPVFARKLVLALLGTLQDKGVLSQDEVETILVAARNSAQADRPTEFYGESTPAIDLEL